MLLQQRSMHKYHSGGLWTNACCSHPRPGELTEQAAIRRLREELGFETPLTEIFRFTYHASFENGLTEHEVDHVFFGRYNGEINFNVNEVQDVCYRSTEEIGSSLETHPQKFTAWFHIAFPKMNEWMHLNAEL